MSTAYGARTARRYAASLSGKRRSPAVPVLLLLWGGAAGVLALWWSSTPAVVGDSEWITGAGRITGLLAGYGCAVLVGLMARVPGLERRVGSDRIARWHAMGGRYALSLVLAHLFLIVWGYAKESSTGMVEQTVTLVLDYPDMITAAVGTALFVLVGLVSAGAVRRRVSYETWYYLHLTTYAALYLTFWHQLTNGSQFLGDKAACAAWYVLYGGVAALVLWYRILVPVRLNLRHRMRVEAVAAEAPGVLSVLIRGERLHKLRAEPGQFFRWRFMAKGLRWSANPYSLSALPRPDLMRITVKAAGGHSAALATLRPGTRVWAEGPYGALTAARRRHRKVLLVAGGVGITPLRALFEALPAGPGDLTLLYWAHTERDLALRGELEAIADARRARLYYSVDSVNGRRGARLTASTLQKVVPDITRHDVYLCGPPAMTEAARAALRGAGVRAGHIHQEIFEL
ncbi:ferredoxin-NADP reductase [Streptomyces sp. SLBN-118]|uniref:ferredoxin reductase family protein n=1 Tax=Streptomyces sp. SLBN-118 TaxID=2768454 RepID=UPI00114F08B4|nr:ferredoxin reductase family protein [Streptomyces sp. SLBN-118]TQK43403.1 ferredoxin-NADP reductase [Streptomyces sp. SLBN-118]